MSQDTKSLNATHKPDPKEDTPSGTAPPAAPSAAGPVELTAMVISQFQKRSKD